MISRISSIRCSHATAIPSDEGRVYSLVPKAPVTIPAIASRKDTYSDFAQDRFQKYMEYAQRANRDLADNSSMHGYGLAAYAATELIIRA